MLELRDKLFTAATTGTSSVVTLGPGCEASAWTFYLTATGTVTGGTVVIETAPEADATYWTTMATDTPATNTLHTITIPSGGVTSMRHFRGRFTADVTGGGTVTVLVEAMS